MNMRTLSLPLPDMLKQSQFSFPELQQMTRIAYPIILASLVTMSISITDVIMIGQLGTVELAAGAAASDFYSIFFYLAAGVIAAISPLVAHARGARQFRSIKAITLLGLAAGLITAIPAAFFVYHAADLLALIGVEDRIHHTAAPYAHMMAIALFPMLAMTAMHHFLAAHGRTKFILQVTAMALPMNILGNWLLLYGNLGFPNMGLAGAGVATTVTGTFMFVLMALYIVFHPHLRRYLWLPVDSKDHWSRLKEIFRVGLPIGVSHVGEMGVFLFATVTMGIFGAEVLAAHTIALRAAGVFYAVPLGYAQVAAIRIGYLNGQNDATQTRLALHTVTIMSLVFGIVLFALILLSKDSIIHVVLDPSQITQTVVAQASAFLLLLAVMQPATCLGTIGAGSLRGFQDTRIPMFYSLGSFWGFGFLGAMGLAFFTGLQSNGIWTGLLLAAIAFSMMVTFRIKRLYW